MATKRKSDKQSVVSATPAASARRRSPAKARVKHSTASVETLSSEPLEAEAIEIVEEPIAAPAMASAFDSPREVVAQLAYSYWEARGYQGGSPEEDWLRAEQELGASA